MKNLTDFTVLIERRALTKRELQGLFDHVDERVASLRSAGNKGWLGALRDSAALKTAYAFGLRRRELAMLDLEDFTYEEIAAITGIRLGTVRSRLHRARNLLANKLREYAEAQGFNVHDGSEDVVDGDSTDA